MVEIRLLSHSDWQQFEILENESFDDDRINQENFNNLVGADGFIGGVVDDQLIGYSLINPAGKSSHINRIGIRKEYRNKGFGSQLMKYALQYCKDKGAEYTTLYVETKNKPAIKLYENFNFEILSETWHYVIQKNDIDKLSNPNLSKLELRKITMEELKTAYTLFPNIPIEAMIKRFEKLQSEENPDNLFLGLFEENEMKVFSRISRSYSGSMPFEYIEIEYVDAYLLLIQDQLEKEYFHLTFDRYKELAVLFENRGYTLHHHLFKMKCIL